MSKLASSILWFLVVWLCLITAVTISDLYRIERSPLWEQVITSERARKAKQCRP